MKPHQKKLCCRSDGGMWFWFYDTVSLKTTQQVFYAHTKEIFERHWENIMPNSTVNHLRTTGNEGAKYSLKFRIDTIPRYVKDLNIFISDRATNFITGSTFEIWGVEAE